MDTSALEEKHRQQLRDLEEAMKSTWEDKERISEEHEQDRRRLQAEQEAAERELREQRERHWLLLEEKGDLDLAITNVRETVKKDVQLSQAVSSWQLALREATRLEQLLGEQDTVVDVYRTSLLKDGQSLLKVCYKDWMYSAGLIVKANLHLFVCSWQERRRWARPQLEETRAVYLHGPQPLCPQDPWHMIRPR